MAIDDQPKPETPQPETLSQLDRIEALLREILEAVKGSGEGRGLGH